jgi:hypothetical protein
MTNELAIVLAAAIGVLGALGGALVGPYLHHKHERWKAAREDEHLLRAKAEELFDELDKFVWQASDASVAAMAKLQGQEGEMKKMPDLGRVRAIAVIYFPTALDLINSFEADTLNLFKVVAEESGKAVEKGGEGLSLLKGLPMITAVKYQELATKLVGDLRNHLAVNVPKLKLELAK